MGLAKLFTKQLSGYPGGYKQMRRGFQGVTQTPPFKLPDDPKDRRSRIPRLGFREYWYPALPAKDVKKSGPSLLRMLGTDVIFFKDTKGEVQALLRLVSAPRRLPVYGQVPLPRVCKLPLPRRHFRWRRQLRGLPYRGSRLEDGRR